MNNYPLLRGVADHCNDALSGVLVHEVRLLLTERDALRGILRDTIGHSSDRIDEELLSHARRMTRSDGQRPTNTVT